ncbi:MAG: hypothetical protein IKI64_07740 [Clostridia bacterium]|nr:hypothetical protein [Clostridia bacterium]
MTCFSRRNGYNDDGIHLECVSKDLIGRIWTRFYQQEFDIYDVLDWKGYTTGIEDMMIEMGVPYEFPENKIIKQKNAKRLEEFILKSGKWYTIFDFIEKYLGICDNEKAESISTSFNKILREEVSAYRILDNTVVPITNESELATIRETKQTKYNSVNTHISKALSLYADRQRPDYENSIKESISAVEAICCIITGQSGPSATLGKAITKLKDRGVHIHPSMEKAFSALYGYTNDEHGIRHGSIDFTGANAEDARYMLITCSAFVNYLIEKWSKIS